MEASKYAAWQNAEFLSLSCKWTSTSAFVRMFKFQDGVYLMSGRHTWHWFVVAGLLSSSSSSPLCKVFYTYIPETNYVPREYSVAAILLLLFMVLISLVSVLNLLYFYISTFRSMCAVPNMAVFCSSLTSCLPCMLLTYFLNDFEIVPVAPVFTRIIFVFTFHMRCISIVRSLYFIIFSASFLITFLSSLLLLLFTCGYSFILLALLYGSKTKWTRCCVKPRTSKLNGKSTGLVITNYCLFSAFLLLLVPELCSVVVNRIVAGVVSVWGTRNNIMFYS